MIRINLLDEKPDYTALYIVQGAIAIFAIFLTVVICFVMQINLLRERTAKEVNEEQLKRVVAQLKEKTERVEDLQKKEETLRTKIRAIKTLKALKQLPVKILDELTRRVPQNAWLSGVKEKSGSLELTGVAMDNQTVSNFLLALEQGDYFGKPELSFTEELLYQGVKFQRFMLNVPVKDPLKVEQEKMRKLNGEKKNEPTNPSV